MDSCFVRAVLYSPLFIIVFRTAVSVIKTRFPVMSSTASVTPIRRRAPVCATLVVSAALSADVRLLTFAVPGGLGLEFLPGQSIGIEFETSGQPVSLSYSIASPPGPGDTFELCVKAAKAGSLPGRLFALSPGMQIRFSPPRGNFVLRPADEHNMFLAAGTGIAPIRSMIRSLLREPGRHNLRLLFGARDEESLLFHSEFLALEREHPRFRYFPVLSRPGEPWDGARGHVQQHLAGILPGPGRAYLCGPVEMVKSASAALARMGWPGQKVHYDRHACR
jgi:CDP-4-dehydro-6-deoxyglucose reductase, E3